MNTAQQITLLEHDCLLNAMQETFENCLFVEVMKLDNIEALKLLGTVMVQVKLRMKGPIQKKLTFCISRESALRLSQNLQGDGLNSAEELMNDLFAESLNTLAGRYAYNILGPGQVFDLTVPAVSVSRDQPFLPGANLYGFKVDFATVLLSLEEET